MLPFHTSARNVARPDASAFGEGIERTTSPGLPNGSAAPFCRMSAVPWASCTQTPQLLLELMPGPITSRPNATTSVPAIVASPMVVPAYVTPVPSPGAASPVRCSVCTPGGRPSESAGKFVPLIVLRQSTPPVRVICASNTLVYAFPGGRSETASPGRTTVVTCAGIPAGTSSGTVNCALGDVVEPSAFVSSQS